MRFTDQKNSWWAKSLSFTFGFLLFGGCLLTVSCQTKEQKVSAVLKRCQDLLDKGELANISGCYTDAMKANPEDAAEISKAGKTAIFLKCVDYKQKSDFKNAIVCFEGFTELEPNMANNYFQLAHSYYEYFKEDKKATGKPDLELLDRAENAVKKGLKINNEDAAAHSLYGQIAADKNDKQSSLVEHQWAVKLAPKTAVFWTFYTIAQEKFGADEEAIKSCRQALDLEPENPTALELLGKLYIKVGKTDEAIKTFEKLLKIEPGDDETKQKLEDLKRQRDAPTKSKVKTGN